jgi:hypothetical protein
MMSLAVRAFSIKENELFVYTPSPSQQLPDCIVTRMIKDWIRPANLPGFGSGKVYFQSLFRWMRRADLFA